MPDCDEGVCRGAVGECLEDRIDRLVIAGTTLRARHGRRLPGLRNWESGT